MSWHGLGRADLGAIAVGGIAGATLRWLITGRAEPEPGGWFAYTPDPPAGLADGLHLPASVLAVNVAGCLLLGGFTMALTTTTPGAWRRTLIALATGMCGSLTTFSTFAVDTADLLGARYPAHRGSAALYVALSLVGGGVAFATGRRLIATVTSHRGDVSRAR